MSYEVGITLRREFHHKDNSTLVGRLIELARGQGMSSHGALDKGYAFYFPTTEAAKKFINSARGDAQLEEAVEQLEIT